MIYLRAGNTTLVSRMPPTVDVKYGANLKVAVDLSKVHVFEKPSGKTVALDA